MAFPCDKCETQEFCNDIQRCISAISYEAYADGEVYENDDALTADYVKGAKKLIVSEDVADVDLTESEIDILKIIIKN